MEQGLLQEQQQNYITAIAFYDSAIALAPENPRVNQALGAIVRSYNRWDKPQRIIPHLRRLQHQYTGTRTSRYALDHILPQLVKHQAYSHGLQVVDTLLTLFADSPREPVYLYEQARIQAYQSGQDVGGFGKRGAASNPESKTLQSIAQSYPESPVAFMVQAQHIEAAPAVSGEIPATKDLVVHHYPNPFNPSTSIQYVVEKPRQVSITIYDMLGRQVTTLLEGQQRPGQHVVQWDATDAQGEPVSTGMYFYRVVIGQQAAQGKLLYLK